MAMSKKHKAMEMRHAAFMKKAGAPKSMVKEEMEGEYRRGGSVGKKKMKKYARGGGIEIRGKTRGKFV